MNADVDGDGVRLGGGAEALDEGGGCLRDGEVERGLGVEGDVVGGFGEEEDLGLGV